jgi:hypothetical protein
MMKIVQRHGESITEDSTIQKRSLTSYVVIIE